MAGEMWWQKGSWVSGRLGCPTEGGGERLSWPKALSKVCQGRSGQAGLLAEQTFSAHLPEGKSAGAEAEAGGHRWQSQA